MSLFFPAKDQPPAPVHLGEADIFTNEDADYRRVGTGYRDLLGTTLRRAQNLSIQAYRANPLANRIIKIYTSYLAGTGFSIEATNPEVQQVVDEFWTADRNKLDRHHRSQARDWLLFGEAFPPVNTDDTGNTTVGFIDPTNIPTVKRSPLNNLILTTVLVQPDGRIDTVPLEVVHTELDPTADGAGLYTGQVFAWLHDRIAASTRGTPFLLSILDWLDGYDQIMWELLERQKALRAHFWDVEVDGGPDQVDAAKKVWGTSPPRSGSVRFRTSSFRVNAVAPTLNAGDDAVSARQNLRMISTGAGVAPHWLSDPEDTNRSTAGAMDKPILRSLSDVQTEWKQNMTDLVAYAVDAKVKAGMLPRIVDIYDRAGQPTGEKAPARDTIQINTPEIEDEKVADAAAALAQVAAAFTQLDMLDVTSRDTMRQVIRAILPALGIPAEDLPDDEGDNGRLAQAIQSIEAAALRRHDPAELANLFE